ncbi:MAG TPA: hypothetical protein VF546_21040 [Pyrinomonadaceae bacterium]
MAELVPLVRAKFGANLVALAATASYARGEDAAYSDLELTAFVARMPEGQRWGSVGKIRDGLLVELIWTTKEIYLADTREVTANWYLAGSDTLLPLINRPFIEELNAYKVENLREKCLARAAKHWHEAQEATAKVLNAIPACNREGVPLLVFDMLRHMLIVLSFLNQTSYVTFARFVSQAQAFKLKPAGFDALVAIVVEGTYQDLPALERNVVRVFSEFEALFAALGIELYDKDLAPL